MNYFSWVWIGISFILLIGIVVIISLYIRCISEKIDPSQCLSIKGDYAVITNQTGNAITSCGPTQADVCEFTVTGLNDAVNQCNMRADICNNFAYNESLLQMKIIDPKALTSDSSAWNIFIRQDNTLA